MNCNCSPRGGHSFDVGKNSRPIDLHSAKRGMLWMSGDGAHLMFDNVSFRSSGCDRAL